MQVFKYCISFLKRLKYLEISLSTFNTLDHFLHLNLLAIALSDLCLNKLLFLQVNDGSRFLTSLDEFLYLLCCHSVLLRQLLLVFFEFAHSSLDINDCLVIVSDAVFLGSTLWNLLLWLSLTRLHVVLCLDTIAHISLCFVLFILMIVA